MVTCSCCVCSVLFAFPERFERDRRRDHAYFYCPNGHQQHYTEKSDKDRLKEARAEVAAAQTQVTHLTDQLEATKRDAKRAQQRAAAGVCPCCNRSFQQLRRHMASKHPEYAS